jgi:hypothetical protein
VKKLLAGLIIAAALLSAGWFLWPRETPPLRLDGVRPASDRPLFVRFTVNEDGSRVCSAMLDESGGTGTGYDVVYYDPDCDGVITSEDRSEPNFSHSSDDYSVSYFEEMHIPTGYFASDGDGGLEVGLSYMSGPAYDDGEEISAGIQGRTPHNGSSWEYAVSGELPASTDLREIEIARFHGEPSLVAEPELRSGRLGVVLRAEIGDVEASTPDGPASVAIKTADGELVAEETGVLQDFGFG